MSNIVAIIQARMGSSRFPKKTLELLAGQPMLGFLVDRLKKSRYLNNIVLATTINESDDVLCQWAGSSKLPFFRGSESDVLDRYFACAKLFKADIIVRITADDPLKDPHVIDYAIKTFLNQNVDYVSNTLEPTFPEGIDVEVFSFDALKIASNEAKIFSEREHVTPYIWKNIEKFSVSNFKAESNNSDIRLTVDYPSDLMMLNKINDLKSNLKSMTYKEIIDFLKENPYINAINQGVIRNEGYIKTLAEESLNE